MSRIETSSRLPIEDAGDWFRSLADVTSTAIFVYRKRFLYVNRAAERLSGYSREELAGSSVWRLVAPEHRETLENASAEARERGEPLAHREFQIVRKDGEIRWIDFTAQEIAVDGQPASVGTAVEITERKLAELELEESRERLNLAQRAGKSISWEWHPETDELKISHYSEELFGFPAQRIIRTGEQFQRFVHPDDRGRLARAMRRTLKGEGDLSVEVRFLSPQGDVRWLAEKALAVRDASGWTGKVIGMAHDVTERRISEEALFQEKERALVTLASIADGVIRTDDHGAVDYLNPVAQKLTGWSLAEAYGREVGEIYRVIDDATGQEHLNPVERCLEEERNIVYTGDRRLLRRDGASFAVHDSAAPIRNRQGHLIGAILVFKDLTRLREVEREMVHLASHDPLTGLINRREFEHRLEELLEQTADDDHPHVLCYIDLDQFKLVNDACGHPAGDQLIRQITGLIAHQLGDRDVLARLGGDEFGLLLVGREPPAARRLVETLVEEVRAHRFSWKDQIYTISMSAGLVPVGPAGGDLPTLLSAADAACYAAKESGGNRIHEYEPGDKILAERYGEMHWISRLHKAFDEDRFVIYHQPIKRLTGSGAGAALSELFIRLNDQAGRLIGPSAFIPAAERYGMISEIDRWMIGTALERLAAGAGAADVNFAINVSGQSLGEEGFLDFVVDRFAVTGAAPERVLFEITETAAIANLPHAIRFLTVLKGMGCRFVLDDFGRGLSSFSYLQNLPVDFLKIDGSFVRRATTDPIQAALVHSIHEIGHVMGLETIAEGVEDHSTLEAMRQVGVDYVQGYLLGRPRPLEMVYTPART